ncbi:MAG: chromosome segregation protein SMC [Chitinophagales bacterium]|nr:chromosome segregation protein SMC [Chitinophagales bacterium]
MKLTTLEIKGFKSFADKTVLHFNENITGVVGPNGCGKSNVVDSIRWVLGEQKTSMLRLEKMDNLIFNGTKNRKASGLAEVSLTFENTKNVLATEFKTVTITRRLYRSGDSEYRLNDVPCRLKDITNLFLDTGVSADSYAIIELGMIDEILNDRENSRRRLFEQASGISKYKKRKKETLLKLSGTEGDLERVEDLLYEIENNLKSLEAQARKTKKYYALKEEYKVLSVELAKAFLKQYKSKYKILELEQKQEEDKKLQLESEIKNLEADLEKKKLAHIEKEKNLSEVQKNLNLLIGGVSSKENDRNVLREKLKFEREKNETANKQISLLKQKALELKDKSKELEKKCKEQEKIVEKQKAALQVLKDNADKLRLEHQSLKQSLDKDKNEFQEVERRFYEIEKKHAINKSSLEKYEGDLFLFQEENTQKTEELKLLEKEYATASQVLESRKTSLEKLQKAESKLQEEKESIQKQLNTTKDEYNRKNRILDAKQNEYNLTKSLVDNLEGFPESIKFLKKNASWTKNALLLSDIVYCKEEYRIPIENYLESYLSYYVVQNIEEAIKAVNLLSDASKGRANFFILDEFRHFKASQPVLGNQLHAAIELIEVEEQYRQLVAFLLDKTYFINNEENAEELLKNKQYNEINLLTTSGKFIKHGYSISGGAVGLFEGKRIGRAKNLEKLQKEVKAVEKESASLLKSSLLFQDKLDKLVGETKLEEIKEEQKLLNEAQVHFTATQTKLENVKRFFESMLVKSKNLQEAIEKINAENVAMTKEKEELSQNREKLRALVSKTDSYFVDLTDKLNVASNSYNQNNIAYHQDLSKLQNQQQELNFALKEQQNVEAEDLRNKSLILTSNSAIEEVSLKLKELESDLLSGYADKEKIEKSVIDVEQAFYSSRELINESEAKLKELYYKKQQVDSSGLQLRDRFTDMKLELNSLRERLSVEFNLNVNDIINEELHSEIDENDLNEKVMKIKARIDGFGEINPMAVEAYDEMKTRFDFITAQKKDLTDAKESLLTTIKEIETTAKDLFMVAFREVRTNFQRVFRTLFTEDDKCDLILLDESNPLESKIDIIAKPKGKRPQIIDQLSGGEKTLTATALLFSLYLLKPAPFCIFDEVDAPLDDTNIDKFNKIIQEFSSDSQFIIVTHNKQTMSHVDVIYGVTMQEQGVSKVVPVDFRALKEA